MKIINWNIRGINIPYKTRILRKKVQKETTRIGGEFKAKRAGGDVKKNGMTPYAYVPLQAVAGKHKASNTNGRAGPVESLAGCLP